MRNQRYHNLRYHIVAYNLILETTGVSYSSLSNSTTNTKYDYFTIRYIRCRINITVTFKHKR
uniref:Uncharacterized protein n=1 Tax=Rhizophora mucronata TaxID=61149 RepID=A0A2P2NER5_RHIMU